MKAITITLLLSLGLVSPAFAVELPNFGAGPATKVKVRDGEIIDTRFKTTPTEIGQGDYSNPIDREIAIATYEFTHGDSEVAFERLERVLPQADPGRRIQIESQLFLNYLHLSLLPYVDRSEQWLKRAAELKTDDPRPYRQLRELYCIQRKLMPCKQAHLEAVKRSSDEAFELRLLAESLETASKYPEALKVWKFALEAEREKNTPNPTVIQLIRYQINKIQGLR